MANRFHTASFAVAVGVFGCNSDLSITPANQIPVADARVIRNGVSVNGRMDGGAAALMFNLTGTSVTVTLDGSQSYDTDGTVVAYRWLSATPPPDGGIASLPDDAGVTHRSVPPGAGPNWPGNVKQPPVQLGEGIWSFSLWVTDDRGAVSAPDTIKLTIGTVVDPAVQACADNVVSTEPMACRQCLCSQSDKCRMAVTQTACDQTCWNLVNCIANNCPDFQAMAMAMPPDYSCLAANCSAYTSGSTGATPVAPCFNACTSECKGATSSDGGGGGRDGSGD
jgi:hypothetical protein